MSVVKYPPIGGISITISDLIPDTWDTGVPAIVLDGTSTDAENSFATGIILDANGNQCDLLFATKDITDNTNPTSDLDLFTGDNGGNGNTGSMFIETGNSTGGNSGSLQFQTGNAAGGTTGNIVLQTGTSGIRGHVQLDAAYVLLPQGTADPSTSGLGLGACYFNTNSHALRVYDGTSWKTVTLS